MTRLIIVLLALLTLTAGFDAMDAWAGSSKNPFSGYNIHGINYGAQQWEREHGKSSQPQATRGRLRRR